MTQDNEFRISKVCHKCNSGLGGGVLTGLKTGAPPFWGQIPKYIHYPPTSPLEIGPLSKFQPGGTKQPLSALPCTSGMKKRI